MQCKWESLLLVGYASLVYGMTFGTTRSLGVYFIHFQRGLNASVGEASLSVSIELSIMYLLGPVWGLIYNMCGPMRTVLLGTSLWTGGMILISFAPTVIVLQLVLALLTGPGVGMLQLSLFSMMGRAFSAKRSLANNIIQSSIYCWAFAICPFMQFLIDHYSWRGSLLLIGGMVSNCIPFGILTTSFYFKVMAQNEAISAAQAASEEKKAISETIYLDRVMEAEEAKVMAENGHEREENIIENGAQDTSQESLSQNDSQPAINDATTNKSPGSRLRVILRTLIDKELLFDWCFLALCMGGTCFILCLMTNAIYLVRIAQSFGVDDTRAVWIASILQIISVFISPVSGYMTSKVDVPDASGTDETAGKSANSCAKLRRSWLFVAFLILYAFVFLLPTIFTSYSGLLAYAISGGITQGLIAGMPYTVVADLFGTEKLPSALGIRSLFIGIGLMTVPPIVGTIVHMTNNYLVVMYVASGTSVFGAFLVGISQFGVSHRNANTAQDDNPRIC